mmetsp:Transcript_72245/g.202767  ORF Transcript_72245/g.202767 Transcript_72245/m.202767 type:complete len:139 (+) Transcript_72245:1-417(+)
MRAAVALALGSSGGMRAAAARDCLGSQPPPGLSPPCPPEGACLHPGALGSGYGSQCHPAPAGAPVQLVAPPLEASSGVATRSCFGQPQAPLSQPWQDAPAQEPAGTTEVLQTESYTRAWDMLNSQLAALQMAGLAPHT